jgi:TP901 family phage tail tape measure protein
MMRAFIIMKEGGNATAESLSKMTSKALELGRESLFSAIDAAEGMQVLARAGFNTREVLDSIGPVMNLAIADNLELAESADYVIAALRSFNFSTSEARRVTDIMAMGASKASMSVSDLAEAFKYVAPVAAGMGISIEETVAAIGLLSDSGIRGSMAGTTLRRAFSELISPTAKSAKILEGLGVNAVTASGKLRPFANILQDLKSAGMTAAQAMEVFGQRGGPGMIALLSRGSGALSSLTNDLRNSQGAAEDMSQAFRTTVKGRLLDLKASVIDLGLAFSEKFKKPLADFIFAIRNYVVEIVETGNRTNFFKAVVEGFINAFTPFKGKIEETSQAFKEWFTSLTPQVISGFFSDIRQRVESLIKALESKTAIDTLKDIKGQLVGIKDSLVGISEISTKIWGQIPDPWKPHILSLTIIVGLLLKLFGGVFNIIIGLIAVDALVRAINLKITFGAALMLKWGAVILFVKTLLLGIVIAIGILAGIVAVMTLNKFISELRVVADFMVYISALWEEVIARINAATKGAIAFAKPWDEQAKKSAEVAKEEADLRVGATKEAATQVVISWRESLNKVKDSFNLKTMIGGMGETVADISELLAGGREKSFLERFRPKLPEVKPIVTTHGEVAGIGGLGISSMESILSEYWKELQPGVITGNIPKQITTGEKKQLTEQEAFAESFGETIGKARKGLEKLGSKNYDAWLKESKELLDKFVNLSGSALDSIEAQKELNDYTKKRVEVLTERMYKVYGQGIDKNVKDTYSKSELGGGGFKN